MRQRHGVLTLITRVLEHNTLHEEHGDVHHLVDEKRLLPPPPPAAAPPVASGHRLPSPAAS